MASNRHLGRIVALQTLYELDFRVEVKEENLDKEAVLDRNINRYQEVVEDQAFIRAIVNGVLKTQAELDDFIQPLAPEWPISQIARIDRCILRMSVWELRYSTDVPPKVVINEAVELAKGFGADNSSKFVNGVLGSAVKKLSLKAEPEKPEKASSKSQDKKK